MQDGGGVLTTDITRADAVIWTGDDPGVLEEILLQSPASWVQLPSAGVDAYVTLMDDRRVWTCAKGCFSLPVAELALALLLGVRRSVVDYARRTKWSDRMGMSLEGARVVVLGGGGIGQHFCRMVAPFGCHVSVVSASGRPVDGADRSMSAADTPVALEGADAVVIACALTPATIGVLNAQTLSTLAPGATIVNVARGRHIVTDDLVAALQSGHIGGAGLDVTDPEPLPVGHALWNTPHVVITPHTGNTDAMIPGCVGPRVRDNVERFLSNASLLGIVDERAGY